MNGVYEEWLDAICERHDLECKVDEDFGAVGDGCSQWLVEVRGMGGTEETASLLVEALRTRGDIGPDCCYGTRRVPGEDYWGRPTLLGCGACCEPEPVDRTVSDYAVSIAAARSLK
jgi:hypothetical protein